MELKLFETGKIFFYRYPVSARLRIPGLSALARSHAEGDEPVWVVFVTANRKSVKALCIRKGSTLLIDRSLNHGRYPELLATAQSGAAISITREQLRVLFNCGDASSARVRQMVVCQ